MVARAIACSSMLLVLSSCSIPDLRPPEAAPETPLAFDGAAGPAAGNTGESSAQLGINEFFSDPLLMSQIDQALANNRELKILDEEVQIASNEVQARQGAFLPFLSLGPAPG